MRETLGVPADVRVWQEDGDPFATVAGFLKDRDTVLVAPEERAASTVTPAAPAEAKQAAP